MDIQLMYGPGFGERNGEDYADHRRFHHRSECLITTNTCNLRPAIA